MSLSAGLVGLPNVGKSTLFNALMETSRSMMANYPFTTIDPNFGRVPVIDPRIDTLGQLSQSKKIIYNYVDFVDIAGLVKGASKGEGLGNQFLGHVRSVDLIVHVVRCFDSSTIIHVDSKPNPIRDIETIQTELMLADLESLEKRIPALEKKAKSGHKESIHTLALAKKALNLLSAGNLLYNPEENTLWKSLDLLTSKPVLVVCNTDEAGIQGNTYTQQVFSWAKKNNQQAIILCATLDLELTSLNEADTQLYLHTLDGAYLGKKILIQRAFSLLNQISFFTTGIKETRGWNIRKGTTALNASATIHTDFKKGFIAAEVIGYQDFVTYKGEKGAKEAGKILLEGKEYIVQDGDIMVFRVANV